MCKLSEKAEKMARQVAGTMAIEGLNLKKEEYKVLLNCASGKQSTTKTIQKMVKKYTVKKV